MKAHKKARDTNRRFFPLFGRLRGGSQEVEDGPSYGGHILGGVLEADTAEVFFKGHVEHPMQGVLDAPMAPDPSPHITPSAFEIAWCSCMISPNDFISILRRSVFIPSSARNQ